MSATGGPSISTRNLILNYDPSNFFSYNGVGNTINDLSRSSFSGALNNIVFSQQNQGILSFNGSSSFITGNTGFGTILNSGNYSVNAWVFLSSLSTASIFNNFCVGIGSTFLVPSVSQNAGQAGSVAGTLTPGSIIVGMSGIISTLPNVSLSTVFDNRNGNIYSITGGLTQQIVGIDAINRFCTFYHWYGVNTSSATGLTVNFQYTGGTPTINYNNFVEVINCDTKPGFVESSVSVNYFGAGATNTPLFASTQIRDFVYTSNFGRFNITPTSGTLSGNLQFTSAFGGNGTYGLSANYAVQNPIGFNSVYYAGGLGATGFIGATIIKSLNPYRDGTQNAGMVINNGVIASRTTTQIYNTTQSVSVSRWNNVCIVYSGIGASTYLNGNLVSTQDAAKLVASVGVTSFVIGSNGITTNSEVLNGNIGYIGIYNTNLTQSEVTNNFNALVSRFIA